MPGREAECAAQCHGELAEVTNVSQFEKRGLFILRMKTVSVREMKENWAEIERQVQQGEIFEVLNRGKPAVRIVPATPRSVLKWEDHLKSALKAGGHTGAEAVDANRGGRW